MSKEEYSSFEFEKAYKKRWKELCKFHADKPLAIELFVSLLWINFVEKDYPELYNDIKSMIENKDSNKN